MSSSHSDGPIFQCADCPKKYSKKEHLQRHERTHTGARPFRCLLCERTFARNDVLARHIRRHSHGTSPGRLQPSPISPSADRVTENVFLIQRDAQQSPRHPVNSVDSSNAVMNSDLTHQQPLTGNGFNRFPVASMLQAPQDLPLHQDDGSYLLWPDVETSLQTIMSWDPMAWSQSGTGFQNELDTEPQQMPEVRQAQQPAPQAMPGSQESPTARTGLRALQAINGLVRDTLSTVTASAELSELTPSFLDSSLHMFFTNFVPMLPVIHRPTFSLDASAPLLLNAFAHGSLFLGIESAISKGDALWKLAHTALATSWPSFIGEKGEYDACCGVQLVLSAILSQTYAAFSQNVTMRKTSQTFSGLSMYWAQYCGLHNIRPCPEPPPVDSSADVKMHAWRTWVAREISLRAVLGICIIDGVASQFTGNPSTTWLTCNTLPLPSDAETFNAPNPEMWIHALERSQWRNRASTRFCDLCHFLLSDEEGNPRGPVQLGILEIRMILEILNSMAMESRRTSPVAVGIPSTKSIAKALHRLRIDLSENGNLTATDRCIAMLRWHAVCLDMIRPTSRGAQRMCYGHGLTQNIFGGEWREELGIDATRWLSGDGAKRTILHALAIQEIVTQLPIGATHDVYLAGAIFSAATTYASFALCGVSKLVVPCSIDWETVLCGYSNQQHSEDPTSRATSLFLGGQLNQLDENTKTHNLVYDLVSLRTLLRGMSFQWGVMQEMETVVGEWVARCGQA